MIWKLSSTPLARKKASEFSDQFVVRPAGARSIHEDLVAFVGKLCRAADRGDLGLHLAHQQAINEGGLVADIERLGAGSDPAREKALRRGPDPIIAQPVQYGIDLGDEFGCVDHFGGGTIQFGTVNLERAVEVEGDMAVIANECQRLSFENTEVRGVTQIIALPGIAIDQQHIEAGFRHHPDETCPAIVSDHDPCRRISVANGIGSSDISSARARRMHNICSPASKSQVSRWPGDRRILEHFFGLDDFLKGGHHLREGTGWLGMQSTTNQSLLPFPLLTGNLSGKFCRFGHFATS